MYFKCDEKRSERRKHCVLAVVIRRSQIFSPRRRPPSRGRRTAKNLISWRWSLPLPTNPVWWGSMHAISIYRGNRPTNTHTQTNPQTGPITKHCVAASAQCKKCSIGPTPMASNLPQTAIQSQLVLSVFGFVIAKVT